MPVYRGLKDISRKDVDQWAETKQDPWTTNSCRSIFSSRTLTIPATKIWPSATPAAAESGKAPPSTDEPGKGETRHHTPTVVSPFMQSTSPFGNASSVAESMGSSLGLSEKDVLAMERKAIKAGGRIEPSLALDWARYGTTDGGPTQRRTVEDDNTQQAIDTTQNSIPIVSDQNVSHVSRLFF